MKKPNPKHSEAAKKAWVTIRKNQVRDRMRHLAAKKAWVTMRRKKDCAWIQEHVAEQAKEQTDG